jgi:hypothetical protein
MGIEHEIALGIGVGKGGEVGDHGVLAGLIMTQA